MSKRDTGRGKAPARRQFPPPLARSAPGPVIYAQNALAKLPRRLVDESQNRLIQTFMSTKHRPKRPLKPGYGTLGSAITLRTNFFPVRLPKGPLWDYKVIIKVLAPERETKGKGKERDTVQPSSASQSGRGGDARITIGMKRRIFELLELEESFTPHHPYIAHDYSQRIVAARELPQPLEIALKYIEEGEDYFREGAKVFSIFIKLEREIDINDIAQYLNGDLQSYSNLQRAISALNLIMQKHASRTGIRLGRWDDNGASRYFFEPGDRNIELARGVELWKGFFISVRPTFKQLMVNVNACFTAFFKPGNLAQALLAFNVRSAGAMPRDVSFINIKIKTQHTNFKKRVLMFGTASARETFFYWGELDKKVSVEEYFSLKYKITLRHAGDLPVVSIRVKKKDGRDEHNWKMIKNACNPPRENAQAIVEKGLPSLGLTRDTVSLDAFDISIEPELAVVPGRVLVPPKVIYSSRPLAVQNGAWNLINNRFHRGARVQSWWYIHIKNGGNWDERAVSGVANAFKEKAKEVGMIFMDHRPVALEAELPSRENDDRTRSNTLSVIRDILRKQLEKGSKPSFILVLLGKRDDDIYSGIKRIGDVEFGIHTNHMLLENASGRGEQYLANVALKLNVKLGGKNHTVRSYFFDHKCQYLILDSLTTRTCNGSGGREQCW
ncbi:hypothetical protein AX15_002024 [Amanita polypyramis BW_CC]|nr:hypothetical protein AX15_002024 [Amanita polypyramis BW_CC]